MANQKGGVGKTTTAIHLAHGLSLAGDRVCLIDLDPQANATVGLGEMTQDDVEEMAPLRSVADLFWLLPSPGAERPIDRFTSVDVDKLQALAADLESRMDWLLVDCPPRMDQWGWAGLQLCKEVLVPVQAEFFAIHGLSQMLATLERVRMDYPSHGALTGVVATMCDQSSPIAREVVDDLRKNLGCMVMNTVVSRDSSFVEAASHGRTVFDYRPGCAGAFCYGELVREVRNGGS